MRRRMEDIVDNLKLGRIRARNNIRPDRAGQNARKNEEKHLTQSLLLIFLSFCIIICIEHVHLRFHRRRQQPTALRLLHAYSPGDGFRCLSQYGNAEDALKDLPGFVRTSC